MNIKQAKQIPLRFIVESLGGRFSHDGLPGTSWFYSPFRPDEKTASFKVDSKTNKWHDFARTEKVDAHGDIIDLLSDYYNSPRNESESIKAALKYLRSSTGNALTKSTSAPQFKTSSKKTAGPRFEIVKKPSRIWMPHLKAEVSNRGLTLETVQPYLKQACIKDNKTQRNYNGFAFSNERNGFDISIPNPNKAQSFKTTIGSKGISVIALGQYNTALLFEGFWDFFTWIQLSGGYKDCCYITLNSASNIQSAADQIIKLKYTIQSVFSFLDNDDAGFKATHLIAKMLEPHNMVFGTRNHLYEGYKDLNDYWIRSKQSISNSRAQQHFSTKPGIF